MNPFIMAFAFMFKIAITVFLVTVGVSAGMGIVFATIWLITGFCHLCVYLAERWKERKNGRT